MRYSSDIRTRVIDFVYNGGSKAEEARRFQVGTPIQNRAATSAIVRPSFSRTDKTLRRKSDEYVIRLV